MQYNKKSDGKYEELKQKNVDTGMGVERTTTVLQNLDDIYLVKDLWGEIVTAIEEVTKTSYKGNEKAHRIIADHIRAAVFVALEGIEPSNKERGYVLRRLLRRVVRYGKMLKIEEPFISRLIVTVIDTYAKDYPELKENSQRIEEVLTAEEKKFQFTLARGLKELEKLDKLDAKRAFFLYETYGFPLELSEEIAEEKGQKINRKIFEKEFEKHKKLSRTASAGMFKGGLADKSEEVTKLHTATHLLHAALRKILGGHVQQKGSNITSERLRFDFTHPGKLGNKEIKKVEKMINEQIKKDLPVTNKTMTYKKAIEEGALAFFRERYGEKVKVYTIGNSKQGVFSKEVCGGPHVAKTSEIGRVKIKKQEKIGSGLVRIYAGLESS